MAAEVVGKRKHTLKIRMVKFGVVLNYRFFQRGKDDLWLIVIALAFDLTSATVSAYFVSSFAQV